MHGARTVLNEPDARQTIREVQSTDQALQGLDGRHQAARGAGEGAVGGRAQKEKDSSEAESVRSASRLTVSKSAHLADAEGYEKAIIDNAGKGLGFINCVC